mgnify:CR=1 FL=1|tara:strand:- start:271 stop:786 length:516 start_codon:yes stop_codon:yes gene_type:complete
MANKENTIPGIEGYDTAGLSDGRAKSSAFQLEQEDESVEAGKELLKEEAMESMEEDNAGVGGSALSMAVQSPVQQEDTFKFTETDLQGGDMGNVKKDESGRMFVTISDGEKKGTNVFIDEVAASAYNAKVGGLLQGGDYTAKMNKDGEYELQIDKSGMYDENQLLNVDEVD